MKSIKRHWIYRGPGWRSLNQVSARRKKFESVETGWKRNAAAIFHWKIDCNDNGDPFYPRALNTNVRSTCACIIRWLLALQLAWIGNYVFPSEANRIFSRIYQRPIYLIDNTDESKVGLGKGFVLKGFKLQSTNASKVLASESERSEKHL